ncbi:uncharacterized protein BDW47DRAFT_99674 [Aspergillus candidus]|uniref:Uncharacterized protein n=1 Tax=Aspergillus candidus TaxID=41067 RepID=A0A2I2FKR1_ASPCN|nr:hypothetical protein BDW47DRAFT_99674 [Aspergillus candidus]PLB41202.1 hypothetical protein BDW47DRAFT_99674 [Aspergillus candidus]
MLHKLFYFFTWIDILHYCLVWFFKRHILQLTMYDLVGGSCVTQVQKVELSLLSCCWFGVLTNPDE